MSLALLSMVSGMLFYVNVVYVRNVSMGESERSLSSSQTCVLYFCSRLKGLLRSLGMLGF